MKKDFVSTLNKTKLIALANAVAYNEAMDDTQSFIQSVIETGYKPLSKFKLSELRILLRSQSERYLRGLMKEI